MADQGIKASVPRRAAHIGDGNGATWRVHAPGLRTDSRTAVDLYQGVYSPPMLDRGPGDEPERFFDVLRAMLFYIDEFPERLHHPKESGLLFPRVVRLAPQTMEAVTQLEKDHAHSEAAVRELQHLQLAWELLGESRHAAFDTAVRRYVVAYLAHMKLEETAILPVAQAVLSDADWAELDAAFAHSCDPLTGQHPRDPAFDRLFTRIVTRAPAPIGVGEG